MTNHSRENPPEQKQTELKQLTGPTVPTSKSPKEDIEEEFLKQMSQNHHLPLSPIVFVALVLAGGLAFNLFHIAKPQIYKKGEVQKLPPSPTVERITTSTKKQELPKEVAAIEPNITLRTGFSFYLPEDWTANISNQSKQHFYGKFFLPGVNAENTYVEIESIPSSRWVKNPLITIEKTEQRKINGLAVVLTEGKENFRNSNRRVRQAIFTNKGNFLALTLYQSPSAQVDQFDSLINSVRSSDQNISSSYKFINTVHAAESIAGVDINKYVKIDVMGDPLPERIKTSDIQYKDGYAKFYAFEAFKGQRLTAVAMEDRTTNPGSFIRSELYNKDGQIIDQKDTRIEFDAPYTGTYYYIVRSFNYQEGGFLLKVFDRNQTENLIYLKYGDGSERFLDPTKSPPQYGEKEVAILFQFINPIEVINNYTVRYFAKPREFEPGLGLITTPVEVYARQETYQDFLNPHSTLPEEDPSNLMATKITKLSPSKILIEPKAGGLFPKNHHIVVVEKVIGRYRFFTENPSPTPTLPSGITPTPTLTPSPTPTPK